MDSNTYVGIPFLAGGRDHSGLDCWGLVRLFYKNELAIDLPSFKSDYDISDNERIKELIAQYCEGWDITTTPHHGDVVVFNILGEAVHVGIMLNTTQFLHVRENSDSAVDNINNVKWNRRVEGFYRYNQEKSIVLNAVPHPLKTTAITSYVVEGINLEELYEKVNTENVISPEVSKDAVIMVNGIPVPRHMWSITKLKRTDVVEYRAVAGKDAIKMVALIVIAVYAPYLISQLAPSLVAAGAAVAPGMGMAALTVGGQIAAATLVMAGSALINAIAPVRPPSREDPGSSEQQNLITGGNNPYTPYGAIPVVLGKIRYTPPLGAKSFITYPNYNETTLNMMLVWGYGPLSVDESSMRVGSVPLSDYDSVVKKTLDRKALPNTDDQEFFDGIYGNDVDQFYKGLDLSGPDFDSNNVGDTTELPPYVRPQDSNGQAIQNILYNTYTGQPIWPLPGPMPDDTVYDQQPT